SVGFLGLMYYYVPKQAERPIYSYRLSIVHFWSVIALYIWAGPHHLHYTALPDWAQTLGMVMSIILLAPSWGGMINGMMTLSGACGGSGLVGFRTRRSSVLHGCDSLIHTDADSRPIAHNSSMHFQSI